MTQSRLLVFVRELSSGRMLRTAGCLAVLGGLAACGTSQVAQAPLDQHVEANQYLQHARGGYQPPGPPDDPWGPYISEASTRYDVPERWVREVMRVESGGREYLNGGLITSPVGAMGLMQVMPTTFDEVRGRHDGIGDDPYDPHNNILAGTAYIREMYDVYGAPGFLAAYNAGPRRLDDYLAGAKPLPDETRHYVAMIGPYITDSYPQHRSEADLMALNTIPIDIPPGTRYHDAPVYAQVAKPRYVAARVAVARNERHERGRAVVQLAEARGHGAARSKAGLPTPPVEVAEYAPPHQHGSFHIVSAAMAEPMPSGRHVAQPTLLVSAHATISEARAQSKGEQHGNVVHAKAETKATASGTCHKPGHRGC
jgi:hypothetical protein